MALAPTASVLHQVPIELGDRSYPINIGAGLLGDSATWSGVPMAAQALIVTNTTVAPLYAAQLERAIAARHHDSSCRGAARWRRAQDLAVAQPDLRRLAAKGLRSQDRALRPGRRGGGGHDGFRGGLLHAWRAVRAGAHDAAGPGGLFRWRQDGHQPSAGQEHDRGLLSASSCGVRPGHAGHAAGTRIQRRAGRGHQVWADRRPGVPRLDRGATSRD